MGMAMLPPAPGTMIRVDFSTGFLTSLHPYIPFN
jgi:hypothetical protein